ERLFAGSDDQRRTFSHVRANAAGVIVVMMRHGNVLDRLVRDRLPDLFDRLQRRTLVSGRLHDEDVVVEIDEQNVVTTGAGRVDLLRVLGNGRRRRERDSAEAFRNLERFRTQLRVECDFSVAEVVYNIAIQHADSRGRKDVVADFALSGKASLYKGIACITVLNDSFELRKLAARFVDVESEPESIVRN